MTQPAATIEVISTAHREALLGACTKVGNTAAELLREDPHNQYGYVDADLETLTDVRRLRAQLELGVPNVDVTSPLARRLLLWITLPADDAFRTIFELEDREQTVEAIDRIALLIPLMRRLANAIDARAAIRPDERAGGEAMLRRL